MTIWRKWWKWWWRTWRRIPCLVVWLMDLAIRQQRYIWLLWIYHPPWWNIMMLFWWWWELWWYVSYMMVVCLFVTKVTQVMTSTTSWPQSTCPPNHLRLFKALDLMSWEVKFVCSFSLLQLKKFISDHYDGSLDDDDVYQGCYQG